ncbi:hypothetical protein HYY69_00145 [Candidatus Woesearchaeota archaeon]|nr:hypothetical protein [Candidatus Woesearchaeota archaeon]
MKETKKPLRICIFIIILLVSLPISLSYDVSYTTRETLLFSDFDEVFKIKGKYDRKNVLFVMPENPSDLLKAEIETLKQVLINKGYNPDFIEPINGNDVNCIDKKWFKDEASVQGTTLFIIGTEANNNALRCYPFITSEDTQDTAFIERNLWDNDEYAVIINTNDELVLKAFTEIIKTNEYLDLRSESFYFAKVGTEIIAYAAMSVGIAAILVGSGGTATPAILAAAGYLGAASDITDVGDSCVINPEGIGMCGFAVGMVVIPEALEPATKAVLKKAGDTQVVKNFVDKLKPYDTIFKNNFKNLKSYFGQKTWAKLLVKENDNVYMARGIKRLFGENIENAKVDIPKKIPFIKKIDQGEIIKTIGKAEEAFNIDADDIKSIEFTVLSKNEIGGTQGNVIKLSKKSSDIQSLKDNTINHEYAHIFVQKNLGGKAIWDFMPVPTNSKPLLNDFNEFLTESLSKQKIPTHKLTDLDEIYTPLDFEIRYEDSIKDNTPGEIADMIAQAKLYDLDKYKLMNDFLISKNTPQSKVILEAADEFASGANLLELSTDQAKKQKLVAIQNKMYEVNSIWGVN